MCGIAGCWQRPGEPRNVLEERVRLMAETLVHRGPDDGDTWVEATAGLGLGFRRLAIIDLSPTGRQPMVSAEGRYVIVFNGEIYNYRDLRVDLESRGVAFRGSSDTEVILAAVSQWGAEAAIPRLWGMFAFALWDGMRQHLIVARDRLGKKPLYYTWIDGSFLFGSELKALRAHPAFRGSVDRAALAAYVRFGYVPAPHSIYEGVHKLMPASYAVVRRDGSVKPTQYWSARGVAEFGVANRVRPSEDAAIEELDTLLRDAVSRRMVADVPIGALLSGGIDSTTITALMQAQSPRPIRTFTIGFHVTDYDEAHTARAVSRHLETDHTELYVTPEQALSTIPRLPLAYDEPFADSSQIPTLLVCEMARREVTVSLSGDGGDEVFGGYTRYLWAEKIWSALRFLPLPLRRVLASSIVAQTPERWDAAYSWVDRVLPNPWRQIRPGEKLHKLAGLLNAAEPEAVYERLVSQWKQPDDIVLGGREPASIFADSTLQLSVPSFTERMMLLDLITYLPDDILAKVDRASMNVSLEVRSPLLDHRIVEWAWRLPLDFRRRRGIGKWLLRQVLHRYVPREMVERPKMGFGVPIDHWLRGPLRDWAEALLDERRLRSAGFLRPEPVRRAWAAHLAGHRSEHYRLWPILMFEAWRDAWRV